MLIDVHNHIVPETLPGLPAGMGGEWPSYDCGGGHKTMMISGKAYRKFDAQSWSASARRDFMDGAGVDVQVLSPLPELLSYWFPADATEEMARHVNGAIGEMIAFDPDRFQGLGMVPLQDPARAARMLEELAKLDGFKGVQIGSNINGLSPADDRFSEFWDTADRLGIAVFVHGIRPAAGERLLGPDVMGPIVGIPMDTACCVSSCIAMNMSERYQKLRIGFSHAGGSIASVIDRYSHVWKLMPGMSEQIHRDPLDALRDYYYDILTFGEDYLKYVIERVGTERVIVGTDYPAMGMGLMDPKGFLAKLDLSQDDFDKITHHNANRFLNGCHHHDR